MAKPSSTFGYDDAYQILRLIEANTDLRSLEITVGDFSISIERQSNSAVQSVGNSPTRRAAVASTSTAASSAPEAGKDLLSVGTAPSGVPQGQEDVSTTIAGVFYSAPSPGAEPFVVVGSRVESGDTIGIIEVMKLMSTVSSPVSGTIREIFVANGDLVQFDQALVRVERDGESQAS